MGAWHGGSIRDCDGLVDVMSYWTFSDVFEEQGVVKKPFYGGYGLIAAYDLPKPAFNAFKMLHLLGDTKIPAIGGDEILATRAKMARSPSRSGICRNRASARSRKT